MRIEEEIQQTKFRSNHQKAVINLLYTASWLQNKQQEFFKAFGITGQQFNILRILRGQHPKSISGTEIKSRMMDKNSDVSRILDRLLTKQLVTKKVCPDDKRASDVSISMKGLDLLKDLDKKQKEIDSILCVSETEAILFSNLLDKARG